MINRLSHSSTSLHAQWQLQNISTLQRSNFTVSAARHPKGMNQAESAGPSVPTLMAGAKASLQAHPSWRLHAYSGFRIQGMSSFGFPAARARVSKKTLRRERFVDGL